jgi:hypothetical protein
MTEQESGVARPPYPREPNVHSGGEQEPESGGRLIPPYDDRQKTGKGEDELAQERGGAGKSDVGPRDVSQEELGGMEATDINPPVQHGVGETTTTSGEDLMRGTSEEARRKERLEGGIADTGKNVDEDSPVMRTGDQGG